MKKRAVVICPGRGSYTKETLGYLRQHGGHVRDFLKDLDQRRAAIGEPTISELDNDTTFKPQLHTKGEHASPLIYACSYADFMGIDREKYDIVAVTGNSMGWYLTLAYGGSLDWAGGFAVVNGMGSMMKEEIIGGQVIYPVCDEEWRPSPARWKAVHAAIEKARQREGAEVHLSIHLGGYVVLGANKAGVAALLKELPAVENYPFQLINHAAFHTPLLKQTSEKARQILSKDLFHRPQIPLIDGRGHLWTEFATSRDDIFNYTFQHQVVQPYDFTTAITVALKEFCPDRLVLLGPGNTLGGAIGQILVQNKWLQISAKSDFIELQKENPFLISLGRP